MMQYRLMPICHFFLSFFQKKNPFFDANQFWFSAGCVNTPKKCLLLVCDDCNKKRPRAKNGLLSTLCAQKTQTDSSFSVGGIFFFFKLLSQHVAASDDSYMYNSKHNIEHSVFNYCNNLILYTAQQPYHKIKLLYSPCIKMKKERDHCREWRVSLCSSRLLLLPVCNQFSTKTQKPRPKVKPIPPSPPGKESVLLMNTLTVTSVVTN